MNNVSLEILPWFYHDFTFLVWYKKRNEKKFANRDRNILAYYHIEKKPYEMQLEKSTLNYITVDHAWTASTADGQFQAFLNVRAAKIA